MLLLTLMLCFGATLGMVDYSGYQVVKVVPKTEHELRVLAGLTDDIQLDFWMAPSRVGRDVLIMASPDHYRVLRTTLRYHRIQFSIHIEDVQQHINENSKPVSRNGPLEDFDDYKSFAQIEEYLTRVVGECGSRCSQFSIGQTYEGRELNVVQISTGTATRSIWVDAGIHAREWLAFSTGLFFIDRLIYDFGVDPEVDAILADYNVFILPAMNADGYEYTSSDDRMWRKSRQPNAGSSCVGTDVNRNFEYMWMEIGASDNPCSETFAGPDYYSEPEALAVANFIKGRTDWEVYMTLHCHGNLWMAPMGWTDQQEPDYDELMRVGQAGVDAIVAISGEFWEVGAASEILYFSSGTSRDFARGIPDINYVYTLELTGEGTFILPASHILETGEETWAGFKAMMDAIMNP